MRDDPDQAKRSNSVSDRIVLRRGRIRALQELSPVRPRLTANSARPARSLRGLFLVGAISLVALGYASRGPSSKSESGSASSVIVSMQAGRATAIESGLTLTVEMPTTSVDAMSELKVNVTLRTLRSRLSINALDPQGRSSYCQSTSKVARSFSWAIFVPLGTLAAISSSPRRTLVLGT
jgi:hypothetical protein